MATFWDYRVTDTIVIDFCNPLSAIGWASFSNDIQKESGSVAMLSELAELTVNHRVVVWLSGENVVLNSVTVPAGQQRHLNRILPSLLEDSLASDIDQLHFSTGSISTEGEVSVAVLERSMMEDYIEQFNDAGIIVHTMLPASLATPFIDNTWSLQLNDGVAQLRTASHMCHVFDAQNMALILPKISTELVEPLSLYVAKQERDSFKFPISVEWRGEPVDKLAHLPSNDVMEMNLLQGEFQLSSDFQKYWKQWRSVAILAIVALGIQLTSVGMETWQYKQQLQHTKAEIEQVFRTTFPDEKRIVNAKAQMNQRITSLQSQQENTGFLMLLQQVVPALKTSSSILLSRIHFERRLGEMRWDVKAQDYAQLEQLKNKIDKLGLNVELGSVSGNKGAYTARLTIRGQQ